MKPRSRKRKKHPTHNPEAENASVEVSKPPARLPVNISDGIPDRVENPSRWRLLLVACAFALWASFLICCLLMGRSNNGAM